ncbi:MAG: hypothetical protein SGILL_001349 [Bacillariaceae sp.]
MKEDEKIKKNGNTANNEGGGTSWIVAVMSGVDALLAIISDRSAGKVMGEIVTLKDPSTGDRRDYAVMKTGSNKPDEENSTMSMPQETIIVEFQDIPSDFSSFMVGRHIVKDGSLYMLNRVDPLFFYLATQEHHLMAQQQKRSWQPFEQCFEQSSSSKSSSNNKGTMLPKEVHASISEDQLKHLCLTFENDDVVYFRFDVTKALKFLKSKQERVLDCLIRQDQAEQRRTDSLYESSFRQCNQGSSNGSSNSSSKGENGDKKEGSGSPSSLAVVVSDTKALKLQSIQIVCNYLSEAWATKFVETMGVTMDQVRNRIPNKASATSIDGGDTTASSTPASGGFTIQRVVETDNSLEATNKAATKAAADKKARESYQTPGNKRLAKVSTKGMKSIASFFGAAPKSKKAKHS